MRYKIESLHLKEQALWAVVLSSIEVYRHETMGLLLGYRGLDKFIIEYAIPYQTALKGYAWVAPKPEVAMRMEEILKDLPISVVGDFHSHTQWGNTKSKAVPSGEDIADMEPNKVYIIVAVNNREKIEPWRHKKEGTIIGTIGEYTIELGAYILKAKYKFSQLKIVCPGATGMSY
jgi:proteasome lid subunit RPN8/RPN11